MRKAKCHNRILYSFLMFYHLLNFEFKCYQSCLNAFERIQEMPLSEFPMMYGNMIKIPTDIRTVSKYCQGIDELALCLGRNYLDYYLENEGVKKYLKVTKPEFPYVLTGERLLCPNPENGVTIEALSCMLNMTKYIT